MDNTKTGKELIEETGRSSFLCSFVLPYPIIVNHYNGVVLSRLRKLCGARLGLADVIPSDATTWPIHHWVYQKLRRPDFEPDSAMRAQIEDALREASRVPTNVELGVLTSPGQDLWLSEGLQAVSKGLTPQEGRVPLNVDRTFPDAEHGRPTGALKEALALINDGWPDGARELHATVRDIVPVARSRLRSASVPLSYGAVFLAPGENWTECDYLEHLVHEAGHQALFARQSLVDLGAPTATSLVSPLRQDARSPFAVLHAAFVCARIFLAATACLPLFSGQRDRLAEIAARNHADLRDALTSLAHVAGWTTAGAALISDLRSVADELTAPATHRKIAR